MKIRQYLLKNINLLNVMLLSVAVGLFFLLLSPLLNTDPKTRIWKDSSSASFKGQNGEVEYPDILQYFVLTEKGLLPSFTLYDPVETVSPKKADSAKILEKTVPESTPTILDYMVVSEKNLFHAERKMPADKKKDEQTVVRPEIIFFGAIITDEKKIAYIEDMKNPYSTPGRGKRQTQVVEGAMIGSYKLKEINPETLVLVHGEDKMVVNLRDQKDRNIAEGTKKTPSAKTGTGIPPTSGPQMPSGMKVPAGAPILPSGPSLPVTPPPGPRILSGPAPPTSPPGTPQAPRSR